MKEERLMILNLLNEGKISADEAAKLLDALSKGGDGAQRRYKYRHGAYEKDDFEGEMEDKLKKFQQAAESFSKEFGEKVGGAFKEFEPKFKTVAKTVMEKTASVVDDLARALNESVKNMEEKMKAAEGCCCCCDDDDCCDDECCDDDCCDDSCCDDGPKEN